MKKVSPSGTLVIGFGNPLRGDDGAGPEVARHIEFLGLPYVRVLTVHQLAPELAEDLSTVDCAIFIDACCQRIPDHISVGRISSGGGDTELTHTCDPRALLAYSQILYGRAPQAWWVLIEGQKFEPGEQLSAAANRRVRSAVRRIEGLLRMT